MAILIRGEVRYVEVWRKAETNGNPDPHSMLINAADVTGAVAAFSERNRRPGGGHGHPLRDHGNNRANLGTDQRGLARACPTGTPDIGAYGRQPVDDELFYDGFEGGG